MSAGLGHFSFLQYHRLIPNDTHLYQVRLGMIFHYRYHYSPVLLFHKSEIRSTSLDFHKGFSVDVFIAILELNVVGECFQSVGLAECKVWR